MLKVVFFSIFLFISILEAKPLNIAVASNVSYAMQDIKKEFLSLYPDAKIRVTLGSSGKLSAQILNGAPYDLFMSANMKYPQKLYETKQTTTEPRIYTQGELAYFSTKELKPLDINDMLLDDSIKRIAIANPKTAPYGTATLEYLKNSSIYEKVRKKLVYGESISQTLSFTVTAADIGFIAKSALYSPKMKSYKEGRNWRVLSSELYTPIDQGVVILKKAKDKKAAQDFYDFLFSTKAQNIFKKYGYRIP